MKVARPCSKQGLSTLASVKGFEVPIHKIGKRITKSEATEVLALLDRRKSKSAVARETGISRSKVYELRKDKQAQDAMHSVMKPASPLQEEAWALCRVGSHQWMTAVNGLRRYKDQAFSEKVSRGAPAPNGMVKVFHVKSCFRCGHEEKWDVKVPAVEVDLYGVAGDR